MTYVKIQGRVGTLPSICFLCCIARTLLHMHKRNQYISTRVARLPQCFILTTKKGEPVVVLKTPVCIPIHNILALDNFCCFCSSSSLTLANMVIEPLFTKYFLVYRRARVLFFVRKTGESVFFVVF